MGISLVQVCQSFNWGIQLVAPKVELQAIVPHAVNGNRGNQGNPSIFSWKNSYFHWSCCIRTCHKPPGCSSESETDFMAILSYCTILMILHSNWSLALLKVLPQFCRHASIYIYKPSHISAKSLRRILFSILSQIPALNSKELFEKQGKQGKARPCQSQWLFLVRCQIHTNSKNKTSRTTTSKGSRKKLIIFCNNISLFACGPAHKIRLVPDQQRSQNLFLDS